MSNETIMIHRPSWISKGTEIGKDLSIQEIFEQSNLNWNVEKYPLQFRGKRRAFETDYNALVRASDKQVFGVVKGQYNIFQNKDAFNWCQPLAESDLWNFETAGNWFNGKSCWILLKQNETELIKGDKFKQYLFVNWDHSGHKSNIVIPTSKRVFCSNTLPALKKENNINRIMHNSNMLQKYDELQIYYKQMADIFSKQMKGFKKLLEIKMTDSQMEKTVDNLFPVDKEKTGKSLTISKNQNELVKDYVFNKAAGLNELEIKNTGYGTYMAISEAVEHVIGGNRIKERGHNIIYGKGTKMLNSAYAFIETERFKKVA